MLDKVVVAISRIDLCFAAKGEFLSRARFSSVRFKLFCEWYGIVADEILSVPLSYRAHSILV